MVRVVDGDPKWSAIVEHLLVDLRTALTKFTPDIEHIGSTAVPGLAAKPILDIAARLTSEGPVTDIASALEPLGYEYRGDAGDEGGLIFALEYPRHAHRLVNLHIVRRQDSQWERWLIVRNRLRRDSTARTHYAALKRELAAKYPNNRRAYSAAKTDFINRLLENGR